MVVLELQDGLLLYSPTPAQPDRALMTELRSHGEPRWLVASNEIHNIGVLGFQALLPQAHTTGCVGHPKRVPKARFDLILDASTNAEEVPWARTGQVRYHVIGGNSFLHEIVLLHVPSRTLVVTDAIEHFVQEEGLYEPPRPVRWMFRKMGIEPNRPCMSPEHNFCCQDPDALQRSMDLLASWDFDSLVMCHGRILVGEQARTGLLEAFSSNIDRVRKRSKLARKTWHFLSRLA